jgi:micrococcal nuclease
MYQYNAIIKSVYDGDTCTAVVDLGFTASVEVKFRLFGINTPELRGGTIFTKAQGQAAKARLQELIEGKMVTLKSIRGSDSFGRWLAVIDSPDGNPLTINQRLISEGHAVPYMLEGGF